MIKQTEKKKMNIYLEEACGLLSIIGKSILKGKKYPNNSNINHKDFDKYMKKFGIKPLKNMKDTWIINEDQTLVNNISILKECYNYLSESFWVYKFLIKQLEDLVFNKKDFLLLRHYIKRARYVFSSISTSLNNHVKNFNSDSTVNFIH